MSNNANAAFDVAAALSGNTTKDNIEIAAVFVLGVGVLIWGVRKVVGFFSR
jgi:hypothetical protein